MVSVEEGYAGRAHLSYAFPFQKQEEYISVQNDEKEEIGMIRALSEFDAETVKLLKKEIAKTYFAPKIKTIKKLTERYGTSVWECETDHGPMSFSVKDTQRSLIQAGEDRLFVVDRDGCRFEIESVKGLDRKSYSKIELYL